MQTEGAYKVVRVVGHYNNVFDKLVEETGKKYIFAIGKEEQMMKNKEKEELQLFNDDETAKQGLDELLNNVEDSKKNGRRNLYMLRFFLRKQKDNFALALPIGAGELEDAVFHQLRQQNEKTCVKYDVTSQNKFAYEWLPLTEVQENWNLFCNLQHGAIEMSKDVSKLSSANIVLMILEYSGKRYYIGLCQTPFDNVYKGKRLLFNDSGEIKSCVQNRYFLFMESITFIVAQIDNRMIAYIFDQAKFNKFFNYDAYIEAYANNNLPAFTRLNLVDSWEVLTQKIKKKYVYATIYKILKDEEYLQEIKNADLVLFKKRVLENDKTKSLTEDDFTTDNKIKLTGDNLRAFLNILTKKNRYNFFTGMAEE